MFPSGISHVKCKKEFFFKIDFHVQGKNIENVMTKCKKNLHTNIIKLFLRK